MSAFQPYAGAYEFGGETFSWRCYATARVYEIRPLAHAPLPAAPTGRKWIEPLHKGRQLPACCLVDEAVAEFSQILMQVNPRPDTAKRPSSEPPSLLAQAV